MKKLHGIINAILTAVDETGAFNENAMRELVEKQIADGVSGIFVFGSAGEFYAFTLEEKLQILDIVIDQVAGRVPVIGGCGAVTTKEAVLLLQEMQKRKIDYLSCITPFYIAATQENIIEHYKILSQNATKPILIYHLPARTGINIKPETLAKLKEIENICGIKDSSGNIELFKEFMQFDDENFQVLLGIDVLMIKALDLGVKAAISAPSNAIGKTLVEIFESYEKGDFEQAQTKLNKVLEFKKILDLAPAPTVVKSATEIIGVKVGPPMLPLQRPNKDVLEKLEYLLKKEFDNCFLN